MSYPTLNDFNVCLKQTNAKYTDNEWRSAEMWTQWKWEKQSLQADLWACSRWPDIPRPAGRRRRASAGLPEGWRGSLQGPAPPNSRFPPLRRTTTSIQVSGFFLFLVLNEQIRAAGLLFSRFDAEKWFPQPYYDTGLEEFCNFSNN